MTHRDVFTHTGNHLAAVTTTVDTTDPVRVGEGYVWTTDPATGETHGQIQLRTSTAKDTSGTKLNSGATGDTTVELANPANKWSQDHIDATFYALVSDLAGAPQELINTTTGVIEGRATQTLYGTRTWTGTHTSPLLFAGQYEDAESGWAYNRFRYYNPVLGAYNAQDPLGLAPRLASAQGYVDHAAHWVDVFGLVGKDAHERAVGAAKRLAEDQNALKTVHSTANRGQNTAMMVDKQGNRYFAHGASTDINPSLSPSDLGLRESDTFVRASDLPNQPPLNTAPGQPGHYQNHAEQKLLSYAERNGIQPAEMHSVIPFCSTSRSSETVGCLNRLQSSGFFSPTPSLSTQYPVMFTQQGAAIIRGEF